MYLLEKPLGPLQERHDLNNSDGDPNAIFRPILRTIFGVEKWPLFLVLANNFTSARTKIRGQKMTPKTVLEILIFLVENGFWQTLKIVKELSSNS